MSKHKAKPLWPPNGCIDDDSNRVGRARAWMHVCGTTQLRQALLKKQDKTRQRRKLADPLARLGGIRMEGSKSREYWWVCFLEWRELLKRLLPCNSSVAQTCKRKGNCWRL
jgi:hypothetical protein